MYIEVPEGKERKQQINFLKEIVAESFSNLAKILTYRARSSVNPKKNKCKENQIQIHIGYASKKQR